MAISTSISPSLSISSIPFSLSFYLFFFSFFYFCLDRPSIENQHRWLLRPDAPTRGVHCLLKLPTTTACPFSCRHARVRALWSLRPKLNFFTRSNDWRHCQCMKGAKAEDFTTQPLDDNDSLPFGFGEKREKTTVGFGWFLRTNLKFVHSLDK